MAHSSITTNVAPLVSSYISKAYESLVFGDRPALGMIAKMYNCGGETVSQSVKHAGGGGGGRTVADAQAGDLTGSKRKRFVTEWATDYEIVRIDQVAVQLVKNDPQKVFELVKDETDSAFANLGNRLDRDIFGDGFGTLGIVGSRTGAVVTLTRKGDAANFPIGTRVQWASAPDAASLRDSGDYLTVTGVDLDAGTVTFDNNVSNIALEAVGDSLHRYGYKSGATPIHLIGFGGWLPLNRSSIPALGGVTRSADPANLAGRYLDGRGEQLKSAIYKMANRLAVGAKPDVAFMSTRNFEKLILEVENKAQSEKQGSDTTIMYSGITIAGPKGPIHCMSASHCEDDRVYVLTSDTWKLRVAQEKLFVPCTHKGEPFDLSNNDALEYRWRTIPNNSCEAPGFNGVIEVDIPA